MSKKFNTIKEFVEVISQITNDGSMTMSLSSGEVKVPEAKQFPFVQLAKEMTLDEAIEKMPTAIRFELIMLGYEFLIEDLKWVELDGPEDYWPGRMTSGILVKFPEYANKVDWSKLKNTWLTNVISHHPQFFERADLTMINPRSFVDLLRKNPEFANKFDLNRLNTEENAGNWFGLLKDQPQFGKFCNWSLINDYQKKELIKIHPEIEIS